MKRRPRSAIVLGLAIGGAFLFVAFSGAVFFLMFVGIEVEAVTTPQMTLTVVDEEGVPVEGALVTVEHRTEPHGQLHARTELRTGPGGSLVTRLETEVERILPLCMHGVPQHRHFVCIAQAGAQPVLLEVESTDALIVATVALRRDASNTHDCSGDLDHLLLVARTERPDVLADASHVLQASEP